MRGAFRIDPTRKHSYRRAASEKGNQTGSTTARRATSRPRSGSPTVATILSLTSAPWHI